MTSGCGDASTAGTGPSASAHAAGNASASTHPTAASATPSGAPSATASSSASAEGTPPRPPVTECEASVGHFGGYTPTVDELVKAANALTADVCIPRASLENAIRDCAASTGKTALRIFMDAGGEKGCHLVIEGGTSKDRKWITFVAGFRVAATFDAGSVAVELTEPPTVYLDSLGKDNELCPMTSSTGKLPKVLPAGWNDLPKDARDFLCSGSPER